MHRVAVLAVPPVTSFELSVPDLLFGQAGYEVTFCAAAPGPVQTLGGLAVSVPHGLDALTGADTVLVIGAADLASAEPAVAAALRAVTGRVVALSCAGTFLLAEAGLLAGRAASVGAQLADELRRRYPSVRVTDALYVGDGGVYTCSGHAAAIDLSLHLISVDQGAATAGRLARALSTAPLRPADTPPVPEDPVPVDMSLAATRAWALGRLGEPLSLADLAGHAATSVRTLTRRFRAETGMSPQRWLLAQRLDAASRLLETTDLPIETIARRAGLGTADSLRTHFARRHGYPPSAYRARFSSPATRSGPSASSRVGSRGPVSRPTSSL